MENNQAVILGRVETQFVFDHDCFGEKFYRTIVSVFRDSGTPDKIPVIVSERLFDVARDTVGKNVFVSGEYRSHNLKCAGKKRLLIFLFAFEMCITNETRHFNEVYLKGFVCRNPIYRTTPLGRQIADVVLAVSRKCGKTDYIPCIFWGRNASYSASFEIGQEICILGRIQSREYDKDSEKRIAYEVSISKLKLIA